MDQSGEIATRRKIEILEKILSEGKRKEAVVDELIELSALEIALLKAEIARKKSELGIGWSCLRYCYTVFYMVFINNIILFDS